MSKQSQIENRIEKDLKSFESIISKNYKKEELNENIEKKVFYLERVNEGLKMILDESLEENFEPKLYETFKEILKVYKSQISSLLSREDILLVSEEFDDVSSTLETNENIRILIEAFTKTLSLFQEIKANTQIPNFKKLSSLNSAMEYYEEVFNKYLLGSQNDDLDKLNSLKKDIFKKQLEINIEKNETRMFILSDGSVIISTPKNYIFHLKKDEILENFTFTHLKNDYSWINDKRSLKEVDDFKVEIRGSHFERHEEYKLFIKYLNNFGILIDGLIDGLRNTDLCENKYQYVKQSIFDIINNMKTFERDYLRALFYTIFRSCSFEVDDLAFWSQRYIDHNQSNNR